MKYSFTKQKVDTDLLLAQIQASLEIISYVSYINWSTPDKLDIEFNATLAPSEVIALNAIVSGHTVNTTLAIIKNAINGAVSFGQGVILEYSVTRVLRGTTDAETLQVLNQLQLLQCSLMSGSLKAARLILIDMQPTTLIPQADIDMFLAKINSYLGIV